MKRYKSTLIVGALFALSALQISADARSLQDIKDSGVINVVTTSTNAPHSFLQASSNSLEGIMIDVANAVAKQLGVSAKFMSVPFDGLVPALGSGRADYLSSALFITEKRAKIVDFTVPLYGWGEGVLVPANSKVTYKKFEDLKGKKVGVLEGSVQYDMLKSMKGTTVSAYPDYPSLLIELRSGRIDAALADPPSVSYAIMKDSITGVKKDTDYKPVNHWNVGGAVQKGNTELLDTINGILNTMKADGELHKILEKWGVPELESK